MKNHGRKCLKSNRLPTGNEPRSVQRVEYIYCDVALRKEVKVFEGCGELKFRSIPVGWYEL